MRALWALLIAVPAASAPCPPPSALVRAVAARSAVQVAAAMDATAWAAFLAHVDSGAVAWLHAAAAIRPGVDAGRAEDLDAALSRAILRNPAGVLRLADSGVPLRQICIDWRIEPTPGRSADFVRQARDALRRVADPGLVPRRDFCRDRLGR